ncbi:MAG TPA: hypothetical protein VF815_25825 [Myxococcaceae bacterium]
MSRHSGLSAMGVSDLLGQHAEGATRIVLHHARQQKFRPMVLFELFVLFSFAVLCFPLIIIGLLWAFFASQGSLLTPSDVRDVISANREEKRTSRFYSYWHEIRIRVFGKTNLPVFETRATPSSKQEGDALVASVLAMAEQHGLVVLEALSQPAEVAEVWFGGQPLLAHPEERHENNAAKLLQRQGFQVKDEGDALELRWDHPQRGRTGSLGRLVLSPLVLLNRPREFLPELRDAWADLTKAPRKVTRITVRAGSLEMQTTRGDSIYQRVVIDGRDLVGITFSPTLGYDWEVTRHKASLRFIGRTRSGTLPLELDLPECGPALRDFLVGATIRLRALHPELGLATHASRPAKCPYCGTLHVMGPGTKCPSCGAWAGAFR